MSAPLPQYFYNPFTNNFDLAGLGTASGSTPFPAGVQGWTNVTGVTQQLALNMGYTADNPSTQIVFTLPVTCVYGSFFRVAGIAAGLWKIVQNAGQTIHFGIDDTTTGVTGYLASTLRYDTVSLLCISANTDFLVLDGPQGNLIFN